MKKRIYVNDAEKQKAYRLRLKEKNNLLKEKVFSNTVIPTQKSIEELLEEKFHYSFQDLQDAFKDYQQIFIEHGFNNSLYGDVNYYEKHEYHKVLEQIENEQNQKETLLAHGIPFFKMHNEILGLHGVVVRCYNHPYDFGFYVFERKRTCPFCDKEKNKSKDHIDQINVGGIL